MNQNWEAIYEIVQKYHQATQGPYQEEKEWEKKFEEAKITFGAEAVLEVLEHYNKKVIRKES